MATRNKRPKQPPLGKWRYTVGEVPVQLTAFERQDKGNRIYTRIWDGHKPYKDVRVLCGSVRDRRGRIVPTWKNAARAAALARQREIAARDGDIETSGTRTLAQGFRRLLHPRVGRYASESQQKRDVRRASLVILRVLGPDLAWTHLRHAHYRELWRQMAVERRDNGTHGLRTAEVTCGAVEAAARWLAREGLIEPGEGEPARRWKQDLRSDWSEITSQPIGRPARPRYSEAELRKLWSSLPRADPRLNLAVEIGAELRLGQVVERCRRSDVLPSPDGRFRVGIVRVHGRGKKHGELVLLTMEQRHALVRALTRGYLADLEAAYRGDEIEDYYLIPRGKLRTTRDRRRGKVKRAAPENGAIPLGKTGLIKQWRKLEELAGVEHVEWRNWYGVRRKQSDLAEDVEKDARVLNRLGAWKHTATREHYQQEGRLEILEKVAEARRKIRPQGNRGRTS